MKRFFDITLSLVSLIVFALPMAVLYVCIKMEDRHAPAVFSQKRVGLGGKEFTLYKFRSMVPTSEQDGVPQLCADHDDRLTPVGRFLRDHHLDELPQLWNVLRGDMSFVGHRPERAYFIAQIMERDARYQELYAIRPGLFSMATLYNGYTDTMDKMLQRLRMDLEYLHHSSLLYDLRIIWLTAWSIISGKKF